MVTGGLEKTEACTTRWPAITGRQGLGKKGGLGASCSLGVHRRTEGEAGRGRCRGGLVGCR
jgi:hypothetical protein